MMLILVSFGGEGFFVVQVMLFFEGKHVFCVFSIFGYFW